jgi:hypothetical protein
MQTQKKHRKDIRINNELTVGIIHEIGLQVYHPYNMLIPLELPGYWIVHDEITDVKFTLEALEYYIGITMAILTNLAEAVAGGAARTTGAGALLR